MAFQVPSRVVGLIRVSRDFHQPLARLGAHAPQLDLRFRWQPRETRLANCDQLRRELAELLAEWVEPD
ncbi:MAG: hypothetical protein AAGF97_05295 [Planctomycetota bacterium]